jgi:hypothetical protein
MVSRGRGQFVARTAIAPALAAVLLSAAPALAIGPAQPVAAAVQAVQPQVPGPALAQTDGVTDHHRGGDRDRHRDRRDECRRHGGLVGLLARLLFGAHRHC